MKVEAALALVRAIDVMRAEVSEANADALLSALDDLILLPDTETEPTPPQPPAELREVYGWMRAE